ncbi:MAG: AAA family ATPase, partial [Gammaproteobacteria bacterium]|nr:AAA family ATPase [Gammaproteobacteria bacterium]
MSTRVVIFGNSGSGKSTLAKELKAERGLSHLDLDTLAWQATTPPQRRSLSDSGQQISEFIEANTDWVIEGCYADLLALAVPHANQLIFLDLADQACIENARNRPWEPHKYPSKQAQDT